MKKIILCPEKMRASGSNVEGGNGGGGRMCLEKQDGARLTWPLE